MIKLKKIATTIGVILLCLAVLCLIFWKAILCLPFAFKPASEAPTICLMK